MRTRITALLLACVMTVSLLPVSALALESSDNNTAAQEATVITTPQEFATMTSDGAYRLGADITVDVPYAGGRGRYGCVVGSVPRPERCGDPGPAAYR